MKSSTADVIESASENGVKSLLGYGLDLVKEGLTTIEEVEKVVSLTIQYDDYPKSHDHKFNV